jgi:DNA polymerase-1
VIDKNEWKEQFNIGLNAQGKPLFRPRLTPQEFRRAIDRMTKPVYKTCASICDGCDGKGSFFKQKKDGTSFKKATKCATCNGVGVKQTELPELAGFNLKVSNVLDTSANGFVTGKDIIGRLISQARANNNQNAITFLESMQRLNAVSTYLTSFVKGIQRNTRASGLLHTTFNQCRTATGRLSSSDPNFQNQPRGGTFPVRKCVVSRFDGGSIMEADFSGLEFRVAGVLSQDAQIFEDIKTGKDVHKQTAAIINMKSPDEVTKDERQQAKAYTFAPLYGGSGAGEPEHIRNYFNQYFDIYSGLSAWHTQLKNQVLKDGTVTLPSGRQLRWQNVERQSSGRVTYATQIVNYPVQSFATADIVPLACIRVDKKMKDRQMKSLCVLTVHDSIVIDVYPGEEKELVEILASAMENVDRELEYRYDYEMSIPLDIEIKSGPNWLEGKVIYE